MFLIQIFEQLPELGIAIVLGFVVGITIHEAAHAYSAYRLGDDTAYRQGRVTLNPVKHLDVFGSLMLLIIGFGWGRPTPFVPAKLRGGALGPVAVAVAGPISNLLIVALCAVVFGLAPLQGGTAAIVIVGIAFVNALLFVFNLIPIPPLDGSKVLYPFLPGFLDPLVRFMNQYGPYVLLGLVFLTLFVEGVSPLGFVLGLARPILQAFGLPVFF